jgi:hypothetical protein
MARQTYTKKDMGTEHFNNHIEGRSATVSLLAHQAQVFISVVVIIKDFHGTNTALG